MADLVFNKDLVFLDIEAKDNMEALDKVAKELYKAGNVKESYIEAVKEREKVFATGLPADQENPSTGLSVAVPHTDVEHVNVQSLVVATLKNPVEFNVMAGAGETCKVSILFMLALKEPHQQLTMLQTVISIIQQKDKLEEILQKGDKDKIVDIVLEEYNKQLEEEA